MKLMYVEEKSVCRREKCIEKENVCLKKREEKASDAVQIF